MSVLQWKKKISKLIYCVLLIVVVLNGCGLNIPSSPTQTVSETNSIKEPESSDSYNCGSTNIRVFNVGQGLSILFQLNSNQNILYDGGGRSTSSYLVSRLRKLGVDKIDYVVVSHYDEDHIAGLVGLLHTLNVENVICPDYENDTKIYQSLINEITSRKVNVIHPKLGDQYNDGTITMNILSADNKADEDNDRSIAVEFVDNTFSMLVTGDCSVEKEKEIIEKFDNLDCDVYVAAHHGSRYSSSEEFLTNIKPENIIISCGKDNSYGHPHDETLERFNACGAKVYRTDQQGEILIDIREQNYYVSTEHEDAGEIANDTNVQSNEQSNYVLNINTRKVHKTNCSSVPDISEKNIKYTGKSIMELETEGYEKCKRCFVENKK